MNEHERFMAIRQRRIDGLPSLAGFRGKSILVTGGTGCIGSRLLRELSKHAPARLASISRVPGLSPWPMLDDVDYRAADIRNYAALLEIMNQDWDIVFHTAAQRDPGKAEINVAETITTNVFGSAQVLRAAEATGVPKVIFASTGKALRPFSPDVYTASKRIAEWLLATSMIPVRGAGRFTHVVDNSLFYDKLQSWCHYGKPVELHGRHIVFYLQSATEAAELLMGAAVATPEDVAEVHSITNVGMPVGLYDLAVQTRDAMRSESAISVVGYDRGYEEVAFPGLYDPLTAGEVSPLINAFEASVARQPYDGVDSFALRFGAEEPRLDELSDACRTGDAETMRQAMNNLSWSLMRAAMRDVAPETAQRVAMMCKPHHPLRAPHDTMLEIITERAEAYISSG